jgi:hypothetical protein
MALYDMGLNVSRLLLSRNESQRASEHSRLPISSKFQYAYMMIATLCLVTASLSIVVCTLSLRLLTSFRNENDYLNAFIQGHLSSVLFMNKYLFIKDPGFNALSLLSPVLGRLRTCWGVVSVHAREYGPAVALALLTTHLFAKG